MNEKILIYDEALENRREIADMLSDEYEVGDCGDYEELIRKITDPAESPSVLIINITFPDAKGLSVLEKVVSEGLADIIPIVAMSERDNKIAERKCYLLGAYDYMYKPYDEVIVRARIRNAANLYHKSSGLKTKVSSQEVTLNKQLILLQKQAAELQKSNNAIIEILGTVVESRSLESDDHVKRVKSFTYELTKNMMDMFPEYRLTARRVEMIASASALHDVGKIAIPDSILLKPGKLTNDEFDLMKSHTIRGEEIIDQIKNAWDREYAESCADICRHHHERFDGRGYPDRLTGDDISVGAQCVALADVYDVLVSERVYKAAYTPDEAFHMIVNGEAGTFSPKLIECLRKCKGEFEEILRKNKEAAAKEKTAPISKL
ncbi:MAG TPA: two-component system response regulator [Lachnospiraceae bacterium]|nr:two-component system response regulator [Lachnospiraceae bacterium]